MVTLLGVPAAPCKESCCSLATEELSSWAGNSRSRLVSGPDGVAVDLSADMLVWARFPLSKRGRFLVTDESASSIGFRRGGLGPAELARLGVHGEPTETDSITLFLPGTQSVKNKKETEAADEERIQAEQSRSLGISKVCR